MPQDTRTALFLMGELVYALRANDSDAFRQWLSGGVQGLGKTVVEELLLDWLCPSPVEDEEEDEDEEPSTTTNPYSLESLLARDSKE